MHLGKESAVRILKAITAILVTTVLTVSLVGCVSGGSPTDTSSAYKPIHIQLTDGRTIECIEFNTYAGFRGLDCNWDRPVKLG